ncbi:MAG: phosphate/phosphite/phosphonate ABC transporter substrate-binding protein [Ilumatobacteraceae bacterium]
MPHATPDPSYACLAMYPFEPIRTAWEGIWDAVHRSAPWTPAALRWTDDVQATWVDPHCVVGQACGWPVAALLSGSVEVVGAFALTIPDARGHRYRSVLVARDRQPLDELAARGAIVAANSADSLSGWISLLAAVAAAGITTGWPGEVVWSGAHIASLGCVQDGRAEMACIDPLSLAHIRRHFPDLVAGLHEIGHGPLVPSPPVIVPAGTPPALIASLRDAFTWAASDPAVTGARAELRIDGFVALDHDEYQTTLALATA